MWDLTVPGNNDHDFYALPAQAGDVPVLVHNNTLGCGEGRPEYSTRTERAGDLPGKYAQGQSTRDFASQWYHEMPSNDELLAALTMPMKKRGSSSLRRGGSLGESPHGRTPDGTCRS
jgi:hypothetical protein